MSPMMNRRSMRSSTSLNMSSADSQVGAKTKTNISVELVLTPSKKIPTASAKLRLVRTAEEISVKVANKPLDDMLVELQMLKKKGADNSAANLKISDVTFLVNHVIYLTKRLQEAEASMESSVIPSSQPPTDQDIESQVAKSTAKLVPLLESRLMPRVLDAEHGLRRTAEEAKSLKQNIETMAAYQKKCVGLHKLQTDTIMEVDERLKTHAQNSITVEDVTTLIKQYAPEPEALRGPPESRLIQELDQSVMASVIAEDRLMASDSIVDTSIVNDEDVEITFPEDDDYFNELSELMNESNVDILDNEPPDKDLNANAQKPGLNANAPPFEPFSEMNSLPGRTPNGIAVQAEDSARDTIQERLDNHFSIIVSGIRVPRTVRRAAKIREIERQQVELKIRHMYSDFVPEMVRHYKALKPYDYPEGAAYSMKVTFKEEKHRNRVLSSMGMDSVIRPYMSKAQCERFEREMDLVMQEHNVPFEPSFLFHGPSAIGGPYKLHRIEHMILKKSLQPKSNNLKQLFGHLPLREDTGPASMIYNWHPMPMGMWIEMELPVQQFFNGATTSPPSSWPSMAALRDAGTAIRAEDLIMMNHFTDVLKRPPPRSQRGAIIV